jgi:hypothetical protein
VRSLAALVHDLDPAGGGRAAEILHRDRRARLLAIPHWLERVAAGVLRYSMELMTEQERRSVEERRGQIEALRQSRRRLRGVVDRCLREERTTQYSYTIHGIEVVGRGKRTPWTRSVSWVIGGHTYRHMTRRQAVRRWLHDQRSRRRTIAPGIALYHVCGRWEMRTTTESGMTRDYSCMWPVRPSPHLCRAVIARWRQVDAQRRERLAAARPDPAAPTTLGWRAWIWSPSRQCLLSPHQMTEWTGPELRAEVWSDSAVIRGEAGIHARRMPVDWRRAGWVSASHTDTEGPSESEETCMVTGIVERMGRYVLGTTGWRAEWVLIRELCAPDLETYTALRRVYPEVTVHLSPYCATPLVASEATS